MLGEAIKNPRNISTLTPSSQGLARAMVNALPRPFRHVVEIGPGTGPITACLLDSGLSPQRLLAIEANSVLGRGLRTRFPAIQTAIADAKFLPYVLRDSGWPLQVEAIVSSLGLRSMPPEVVASILQAVNGCLAPGGVFVQFTYRLHSSISPQLQEALGWEHERVAVVWSNFPPASVHRYTKRAA